MKSTTLCSILGAASLLAQPSKAQDYRAINASQSPDIARDTEIAKYITTQTVAQDPLNDQNSFESNYRLMVDGSNLHGVNGVSLSEGNHANYAIMAFTQDGSLLATQPLLDTYTANLDLARDAAPVLPKNSNDIIQTGDTIVLKMGERAQDSNSYNFVSNIGEHQIGTERGGSHVGTWEYTSHAPESVLQASVSVNPLINGENAVTITYNAIPGIVMGAQKSTDLAEWTDFSITGNSPIGFAKQTYTFNSTEPKQFFRFSYDGGNTNE